MDKPVYLDHHTVSKPFPEAIHAYCDHLKTHFASLLSPYDLGQKQVELVNDSVVKILELLGAPEHHFVVTGSGAEAIAQVYYFIHKNSLSRKQPATIVTTEIEEAPTLLTLSELKKSGLVHKIIPVDGQGRIQIEALKEILEEEVSLVSLSWANGLIGVIQPLEEIISLCKEKRVLLHVDASHVLGKEDFCLNDLGIDFLTFDGARIHAPKATGALVIKEEIDFSELIRGKEPVAPPALLSLRVALEKLYMQCDHFSLEVFRLRDRFEKRLQQECEGVEVLFRAVPRVPHVSVVAFSGIESESLLFSINQKGIFATFGGGVFPKLSHVLSSCGFKESKGQTALSFALAAETTQKEIEHALKVICERIRSLQKVSLAYT
jgi:cysteine desulfurase